MKTSLQLHSKDKSEASINFKKHVKTKNNKKDKRFADLSKVSRHIYIYMRASQNDPLTKTA